MVTPGSVYFITHFIPTVDRAPQTQAAGGVVVAPGGTVITFSPQFHQAPFVQVTAISSTALYATAASVSATQFTAHVFNNAGSDVGGTVNWSATGE